MSILKKGLVWNFLLSNDQFHNVTYNILLIICFSRRRPEIQRSALIRIQFKFCFLANSFNSQVYKKTVEVVN